MSDFRVDKSDLSEIDGELNVIARRHISYDDLVKQFGEPTKEGPITQDRRVWWKIVFDGGVVILIFDYDQSDIPIEDVTKWTIASNESTGLERLSLLGF